MNLFSSFFYSFDGSIYNKYLSIFAHFFTLKYNSFSGEEKRGELLLLDSIIF